MTSGVRTSTRPWRAACLRVTAGLVLAAAAVRTASAYSFQTHEELVDLAWKTSIVPLLEQRFPGITKAQLDEAHSYAYGGCAIQDIGYYPLGNHLFSDLTHYVRSGDFVASLLRNARTADELSFAIGALSHYLGDTEGHASAINPSVAVEFPKLRERYGSTVNYEQNPHAHVQTEFAFDINETAKQRFAPLKYLNHVGLQVSTDLLRRAVFETYGLDLDKVLKVRRKTIGGYRFAVRVFLPRIAYAETLLHRKRFPADVPSAEQTRFENALAQASAENGWEPYRRKAGIGTHLLAGVIFMTPKFGPAALLGIKGPDATTVQLYVSSVNRTTDRLHLALQHVQTPAGIAPPVKGRQAEFVNKDLDTGAPVRPGGYRLTDETYARLLTTLTADPARKIPSGLREDLLAYYADPAAPISTKKHRKQWVKVQTELAELQQMSTVSEP